MLVRLVQAQKRLLVVHILLIFSCMDMLTCSSREAKANTVLEVKLAICAMCKRSPPSEALHQFIQYDIGHYSAITADYSAKVPSRFIFKFAQINGQIAVTEVETGDMPLLEIRKLLASYGVVPEGRLKPIDLIEAIEKQQDELHSNANHQAAARSSAAHSEDKVLKKGREVKLASKRGNIDLSKLGPIKQDL